MFSSLLNDVVFAATAVNRNRRTFLLNTKSFLTLQCHGKSHCLLHRVNEELSPGTRLLISNRDLHHGNLIGAGRLTFPVYVSKTTIPLRTEATVIATMFKQISQNLLELPTAKVTAWLDTFDTVLTDCDGVLWIYSNVLEGAVETMNRFKELGKKIYFCTNNSTKTRKELLEKAQKMGFNIEEDEIISTAHSAAAYLKKRNFNKRVYVIGTEGITKELDAVGIGHNTVGPDVMQGTLAQYLSEHFKLDDDVGAVIVGFDEHFSFPKMTKAASYLSNPECLFIATNTDERFPMPNLVIPGSGSFVRAVEVCAERTPLVIGKPNPGIVEWLIADGKINPSRTLMIGDRCNTDILLGYNCGFQTMLVATGIHQLNDVESWQKSNNPDFKKLIPDVFLPKLGDLLPYLEQHQ